MTQQELVTVPVKEPEKEAHKRPMPGNLVRIFNSQDCLIKDSSFGVIEGIVGEFRDEYLVCFNAYSVFRDKDIVSASGGPAFFIKVSELKETAETKERPFWKWKDLPRADGGEQYTVTETVWDFTRKRAVYMEGYNKIKMSVTGCINCNTENCKNGSKYRPSEHSDYCANRVFAGDEELHAFINSQY